MVGIYGASRDVLAVRGTLPPRDKWQSERKGTALDVTAQEKLACADQQHGESEPENEIFLIPEKFMRQASLVSFLQLD